MASDFLNTICSAHLTCLFVGVAWACSSLNVMHQRLPILGVKVTTRCAVFKTPTLLEARAVADDGIDLCSARQVLRLRHARPRQ